MAITLRRSLKHSHVEIIQINFTLVGSYHSNAATDAIFDVSLNLYMFCHEILCMNLVYNPI